jgi:actin-related protein
MRYDVMKDMYANIVLSCGATMFDALRERIEKEIACLAPATMKVKGVLKSQRK